MTVPGGEFISKVQIEVLLKNEMELLEGRLAWARRMPAKFADEDMARIDQHVAEIKKLYRWMRSLP